MKINTNFVKEEFIKSFNYEPDRFFISPGRLEIIGNHTDHNHGFALVASATLYIKCAVHKRDDGVINLNSAGSLFYDIKVERSEPDEKEFMTSNALIKGVVNGFLMHGYNVGGFDAYCYSDIPSGSGVSSSAAFELLICAILNGLYNDNKIDKIELAKISQMSERDYFGKPCGILDQIGAACGGICFVDFLDPSNPIVKNTNFPFDLKIVLTNPGGSHAGLTSYYASIPNDMYHVAHLLGKEYLRECSLEELEAFVRANPGKLTEREFNRAFHFFKENERVHATYDSIVNNNVEGFIVNINASGQSSSDLLRNTCVPGRYKNSPERALRLVRNHAKHSAHRVHGGGFMGTIISFVKDDEYKHVVNVVRKSFGKKSILDVGISPFGATEIK